MILLNVPFVIGWVCLLIPGWADMDTPALFYVGRVLTGIGTLVLIKQHWEFFTLIIDDYFVGERNVGGQNQGTAQRAHLSQRHLPRPRHPQSQARS